MGRERRRVVADAPTHRPGPLPHVDVAVFDALLDAQAHPSSRDRDGREDDQDRPADDLHGVADREGHEVRLVVGAHVLLDLLVHRVHLGARLQELAHRLRAWGDDGLL